jgi:hypothetical protein
LEDSPQATERLSASMSPDAGGSVSPAPRQLFPPPPPHQPPSQLSTAVESDVARSMALLARAAETTVSSHRMVREGEDEADCLASPAQRAQLRAMPRYRWQRKGAQVQLVQRAWAAVADAAIRIQQNGVPAYLAQLTAACNTHNVALTTQQAQTVLVAKGNPNLVGHGLAELAELAVLPMSHLRDAWPLLAKARILGAEDEHGMTVAYPAILEGFAVKLTKKDTPPPRATDAPRTCKECKQSYTGAWPVHWASTCPARMPAAPAPPAPSGAKKGF